MGSNGLREMVTNVSLRTKKESSTTSERPRSVINHISKMFDDIPF